MADNLVSDLVKRLRAPMWQVEPIDIQRIANEAANLIERLVRERDECRKWHEGARQVAKLLTERATAAERDAARYRWLRSSRSQEFRHTMPIFDNNKALDAAIDEAMKK